MVKICIFDVFAHNMANVTKNINPNIAENITLILLMATMEVKKN